jgi:hypothetical protein
MSLHLHTPDLVQISRLLWCVSCEWYAATCIDSNNPHISGYMEVRHMQSLQHANLFNALQAVTKSGQQLCMVKFIFSIIRVLGNNENRRYGGTVIVNRSIALQQPVIYVSMNYR